MKFSLIMGTLGTRPDRVSGFLSALAASAYRDVELIVIDQSRGEGLRQLLSQPRWFPTVHLEGIAGLSRARNQGLTRATGDVIAFPDDDCWYPATLLSSVAQRLEAHPQFGGLAVRPIDAEGHSSFPRWDLRPGPVDRFNVWRRCNSNALFLRRSAIEQVGGFDESLGVGSGTPWGAAEDIDYPLRVLAAGLTLQYDPSIVVHHPRSLPAFDPPSVARAESYGGGTGRVLRKHGYPLWFVLYQGLRPLGGALIAAATGRFAKARYHRAILRGRRKGWWCEPVR